MLACSAFGESPPPAPRVCFGREDLIEEIVGLAENLTPLGLIGAGGIGKTSVALTVLHHDRIKQLFGDNRRFIRCDQFPASRVHFLARLSKVIGAGVENPEDLAPLRPSLSSKRLFIVLDNAESILDPQVANGQDIYGVVEELAQFDNVCLCITSRITAIPPDCRHLNIPTLSTEAARSTFFRIYNNCERPDLIDNILKQLDFHPLSVTLLATVAHQNCWDNSRLVGEWEQRRTGVLRTEHNKSLAATIELSLDSPMFKQLGPDARELLGVVAFFPHGVNENNLAWLFPSISNCRNILDKFCVLSLTYKSKGFITMLAPLRDYLRPNDPKSSSLLCTTKEHYLTRMSIKIDPDEPEYEDTRWIVSEDVNVEHLLDVFTSVDASSDDIWEACANFMKYLYWHKPRQTLLGSRVERLPDDHRSKSDCLFQLSGLFQLVGNQTERKRLLTHALKLERVRKNDFRVAYALLPLSDANRLLGLHGEGIRQAREALEICGRLDDTFGQVACLNGLAGLLLQDKQLDAAEETASRAVSLLPERGQEFLVYQSHHVLGDVYCARNKRDKAIHHFDEALRVASAFDWHDELFWIHCSLAHLFSDGDEFGEAHIQVERAKSHVFGDGYRLARAVEMQAIICYQQRRFEDAASEASCANEIYEKLGASKDLERCRALLEDIERPKKSPPTSGDPDLSGEHLHMIPCSIIVGSPCSASANVTPFPTNTPPNQLLPI